jgi:hypothetical protein
MLVGKPERKKLLGTYRCTCEDNIRMYLGEIEWKVRTGFIWLSIGTSGGLF